MGEENSSPKRIYYSPTIPTQKEDFDGDLGPEIDNKGKVLSKGERERGLVGRPRNYSDFRRLLYSYNKIQYNAFSKD